MQLSWDHIRTFQAVAQHGSLLAASRHLGLTQPTVGRHIDLMEERLGFTLFTRGREGMRLTDKGADLVATAGEMLGIATDFERAASGLEERIEGTIRISANEILGALLLPGLIAAFMAEHPMIEIEIEVSNEATNLLKRDADIAVRMFRPTQNDLVARKIRDLPLGLFAHARYLERHGNPRSIDDLKSHVLIGLDRNPSLIAAYGAVGLPLTPNSFQFRCDNNIAGINAVRTGIGIGPLHIGMASRWPEVVQVLPDLPVPPLNLWLACHADVQHNKRIRLVMDYFAERMKAPYEAMLA
ncbi:LysR family transcriptional regulator [Aliiroseovarius subalbicans]|uniref:LysR family transcriptional regulator n=1 Tax=Aliiroseovarius subalbicans TaxID=2925840 RepID=UPI001F56D505|nr:LysR family transcriptional regulator [Aliiroseovarius subalbicans]MCI2398975.1 LysR family transcriptional regulator [Aliiroseovarius subalbicans]